MTEKSIIDQEMFWKVVKNLISLSSRTTYRKLCRVNDIGYFQLTAFIQFLEELKFSFKISSVNGQRSIAPINGQAKNNYSFTFYEWLQFQALFPAYTEFKDDKAHLFDLNKTITDFEEIEAGRSLATSSIIEDFLDKNTSKQELENNFVKDIEKAIFVEQEINLTLSSMKKYKVNPRKIAFFEGDLHLVGESITDNCLTYFPLTKIIDIKHVDSSIKVERHYSKREIDDFVDSIRFISDVGIRLILKISNQFHFQNKLPKNYFSKSCLFTNSQGHYIWAATLEPGEAVYDWLIELGPSVEVLDPSCFKKEFLMYCESKLKKLA